MLASADNEREAKRIMPGQAGDDIEGAEGFFRWAGLGSPGPGHKIVGSVRWNNHVT